MAGKDILLDRIVRNLEDFVKDVEANNTEPDSVFELVPEKEGMLSLHIGLLFLGEVIACFIIFVCYRKVGSSKKKPNQD